MARSPETRSKSGGSTGTTKIQKPLRGNVRSLTSRTAQTEQTVNLDSSSELQAPVEAFTVPTGPTGNPPIVCNIRPSQAPDYSSLMIFTHGAGGTTKTLANFAKGFESAVLSREESSLHPSEQVSLIICFQGNMNLKSRTIMFHTVVDQCICSSLRPFYGHQYNVSVLGGRSMGARAAVIAASTRSHIKMLVLVSYPLEAPNREMREQILLDIAEDKEVLFVIGDNDHMCDLPKLEVVRQKMKAKSWLVTVEGTDHGMSFKQEQRTREMQMVTGQIVADWVNHGETRTKTGDVGGMEGCRMNMNLPVNQTEDSTPENISVSDKTNSTSKRSKVLKDKHEAQTEGSIRRSKRQKTK